MLQQHCNYLFTVTNADCALLHNVSIGTQTLLKILIT